MSKVKMNVLESSPIRVFLYYSIPSVLGFLAISSSGIVDAIFVGNFAGASSLAAINLVMPFLSLIFGITIMLVTGSSVRCGKYIGEKNYKAASSIFTRTMYVLLFAGIVITLVGTLFSVPVAKLLGANEELLVEASTYLFYISCFSLVFAGAISLAAFVKTDGSPILASVGIVSTSVVNILLDAWLVAYLGMGVKGAAIATGAAQAVSLIILLSHFFSKNANLHHSLKDGSWKEIWSSCYNGLSELTNELSIGIVFLMFNWIMISRLGVDGVAAFTVINYTIWGSLMIAYGISDAMLPIISTNLGAKNFQRIRRFIMIASLSVLGLGAALFSLLTIYPSEMIGIFLQANEIKTIEIALEFTGFVKWAFFFSGVNIVLSSFFTALHKPMESALIALSRSLIFPVAGLTALPILFETKGIYVTIPIAESATFVFAIMLLYKTRKQLKPGPIQYAH